MRVEVRQVKTRVGVCGAGRGDASVVTAVASSGAGRGWRRASAEQGAGTAGVGAERGRSMGAEEQSFCGGIVRVAVLMWRRGERAARRRWRGSAGSGGGGSDLGRGGRWE